MSRIFELCASRALWVFALYGSICNPLGAIDRDRRLDQLYHTAWTAKDGAPTYTRAAAETADGFLWFGGPVGFIVSMASGSIATTSCPARVCRKRA
jgi:hypothetical protein